MGSCHRRRIHAFALRVFKVFDSFRAPDFDPLNQTVSHWLQLIDRLRPHLTIAVMVTCRLLQLGEKFQHSMGPIGLLNFRLGLLRWLLLYIAAVGSIALEDNSRAHDVLGHVLE